MSDEGRRKIVIEKIIKEETRKTAERFGHFNQLDSICLKKNLTPDEFIKVYGEVLRNVMKLCESQLKNSFSKRERYAERCETEDN